MRYLYPVFYDFWAASKANESHSKTITLLIKDMDRAKKDFDVLNSLLESLKYFAVTMKEKYKKFFGKTFKQCAKLLGVCTSIQ